MIAMLGRGLYAGHDLGILGSAQFATLADYRSLAVDVSQVVSSESLSARQETFFAALARLERPGMEHLSSRYKPLTLLWALDRLAGTGERLIPWSLFKAEVVKLLHQHGEWPDNPDPQYPFWDLTTSPFWEFESSYPNPRAPYSPRVAWLDRHSAAAGFTADAAEVLEDDRVLAVTANALLERFFPFDAHDQLRRDLCPNLPSAPQGRGDDGKPITPPSPRERRLLDALLRAALECHAVARATRFYEADNWHVKDVGSYESCDLELLHRLDGRVRHVEVKGSSVGVSDVELTRGEVRHSRETTPCDLFVVENIAYDRSKTPVETWGGRARVWRDWRAADADLEPTRFRYQLPPGEEVVADDPSGQHA